MPFKSFFKCCTDNLKGNWRLGNDPLHTSQHNLVSQIPGSEGYDPSTENVYDNHTSMFRTVSNDRMPDFSNLDHLSLSPRQTVQNHYGKPKVGTKKEGNDTDNTRVKSSKRGSLKKLLFKEYMIEWSPNEKVQNDVTHVFGSGEVAGLDNECLGNDGEAEDECSVQQCVELKSCRKISCKYAVNLDFERQQDFEQSEGIDFDNLFEQNGKACVKKKKKFSSLSSSLPSKFSLKKTKSDSRLLPYTTDCSVKPFQEEHNNNEKTDSNRENDLDIESKGHDCDEHIYEDVVVHFVRIQGSQPSQPSIHNTCTAQRKNETDYSLQVNHDSKNEQIYPDINNDMDAYIEESDVLDKTFNVDKSDEPLQQNMDFVESENTIDSVKEPVPVIHLESTGSCDCLNKYENTLNDSIDASKTGFCIEKQLVNDLNDGEESAPQASAFSVKEASLIEEKEISSELNRCALSQCLERDLMLSKKPDKSLIPKRSANMYAPRRRSTTSTFWRNARRRTKSLEESDVDSSEIVEEMDTSKSDIETENSVSDLENETVNFNIEKETYKLDIEDGISKLEKENEQSKLDVAKKIFYLDAERKALKLDVEKESSKLGNGMSLSNSFKEKRTNLNGADREDNISKSGYVDDSYEVININETIRQGKIFVESKSVNGLEKEMKNTSQRNIEMKEEIKNIVCPQKLEPEDYLKQEENAPQTCIESENKPFSPGEKFEEIESNSELNTSSKSNCTENYLMLANKPDKSLIPRRSASMYALRRRNTTSSFWKRNSKKRSMSANDSFEHIYAEINEIEMEKETFKIETGKERYHAGIENEMVDIDKNDVAEVVNDMGKKNVIDRLSLDPNDNKEDTAVIFLDNMDSPISSDMIINVKETGIKMIEEMDFHETCDMESDFEEVIQEHEFDDFIDEFDRKLSWLYDFYQTQVQVCSSFSLILIFPIYFKSLLPKINKHLL